MSCSVQQFHPEQPDLSIEHYPELPLNSRARSSIILPIEVPLELLAKKINISIPPSLEFDDTVPCPDTPFPNEEACFVNGDISIGNVNIQGNGQSLSANIPIAGRVNMRIKYRIKHPVGSIGKEEDKNLHFKGNLTLSSSPTIDFDWGLKPNIDAKLNFQEAYMHFGAKVSVRGEAKDRLEPLFNKEIDDLEEEIRTKYNLKNQLQALWDKLAQPIQMSETYKLWNVFTPRVIHYNEMKVENGKMKLGVGIDFDNINYLGEKPNKQVMPPIPNLSKSKSDKSVLDLNMPVLLSYEEISKIINENLEGNEIELDKANISLDEFEVFGDAKSLFIKTRFDAKHKLTNAKGVLYFKAKPILDNDYLFFDELDFDVKTRNVLVNGAEWILKQKLIQELQSASRINLKEEMRKVVSDINQKIEVVEVGENMILNAQLNEISINDLRLSKSGIFVHANALGKIKASVKNVDF